MEKDEGPIVLIQTGNNRVFYATCFMCLLLRIEWGIVIAHLPIYVHELGGSALEVGLIFTVFTLLITFAQPLWGFLSDYFGKRKIFMVFGMFGLTPIFLLMSTQTEVLPLILLRGSTAIFVGATVPTTLALISDLSSREMVGRNLGINNLFSMMGFAVGPMIGGVVADLYGFSALWVFVSAVCFFGGLIFLFFGSDPSALKRSWRGHLFSGFSGLGGMLRKISVLCISIPIFLYGYSLMGANMNVFYVENLGFSKTEVGLLILIGTGASTLFQPLAGYLSDKYGRKPIMILSAMSIVAGLVGFYFSKGFIQAIPSAILFYNYATFQVAGQAYIADVAKLNERSSMMGIFNALNSFSRATGSVVGGLLIEATGLRNVILFSTVFPAVSIFVLLFALREP